MTSFSCESAKSCACQRIMEPRIIPVIMIHCQKVGIFAKEKEEEGGKEGRQVSRQEEINLRNMQKLYKEDFHKTKNLSDINKKNSLNINGKLFLVLE